MTPLDDQHIVAAAARLAHLDVGAAARALFTAEHADIAGAVAQQREGFLGDRGEHQLALLALGQHFAGVGVDDLSDEVVLVDVHAGLRRALKADARARQLGQTVNIIRLNAQRVLDVLAHFLTPRLGAEDTGLERDLFGGQAHFLHGLADVSGIGRRAAQNGRGEVADEHDLTLGVTRGGRDGQTADLMAAAVESGAAGEQAVAVGYLADILIRAARCDDRTCAAILPQVDIVLGVEGDDALAGRAGGGLDAHAVLQRPATRPYG